MLTEVKKSDVRELYPVPDKDSHKGENGRVLIVGGSIDYFGAPILAAMGALFGGADLVTLLVPECNFKVSRSYYPDFIVRSFPGERLDARGVEMVATAAIEQDCVVMGPGMGTAVPTLEAVTALIKKIHTPLVLDTAIAQVISSQSKRENSRIVVTPHAEEFATIFKKRLPVLLIERVNMVKKLAKEFNVNILLKGPTDLIAAPQNGDYCINQTGNAGLTSGGTGDVLAGLIGRLMAGGLSPYDGARLGTFIVGTAGDELALQKGHAFNATDLAHHLPYTIQGLLG